MGGGHSTNTYADRLAGIQIQTSCQGGALPLAYGTPRITGNLIDYDKFTAIPHTTTQKVGKGGGSTMSNTDYTYTCLAVIALCEGPIDSIMRVWRDKEVTNSPSSYGFTVFTGTRPQAGWSTMQGYNPPKALGYAGIAYVANAALDLGSSGSMKNFGFEVKALLATEQDPNYPTAYDAKPSAVLADILTSTTRGLGWSAAKVGDMTTGAASLQTYCMAMGFAISPLWKEQKAGKDCIQEVLDATNCEAVWGAGSSGMILKFLPYGDQPITANGVTYTPNATTLYDLTYDDFIVSGADDDPISCEISTIADAYNDVPITFADRQNSYNDNTLDQPEPQDVSKNGLKKSSAVELRCITRSSHAMALSLIKAQKNVYIRRKYTFRLGWKHLLLEPMDLVTITDAKLGLDHKVVRIMDIEYPEVGEDGTSDGFTVTAEEWPFGVATARVWTPDAVTSTVPNVAVDPGNANAPVMFNVPAYYSQSGGPEVMIATAGGQYWGGAEVWISWDNSTFNLAGFIDGPATYGTLTASMTSGASSAAVTFAVSGGSLASVPTIYATDQKACIWIGGEIVGYSTATLTGPNAYTVTLPLRGAFRTTAAAHANGSSVVVLNSAAFRLPVPQSKIGSTLYVKLVSTNIFGSGRQDISSITATSISIQNLGPYANPDGNPTTTTLNAVQDDWLARSDKPNQISVYNQELQVQTNLDAQATSFSITTEKTAYDNAVTALTNFLTGLSPAWNDVTQDTYLGSGGGAVLRARWATIASTRSALQAAVSSAQSSAAQAAAISAAATDAASKVSTALTTAANDATAKANAARTNAVNDINTAVAGMVSGATSAADAVSRVQTAASNAQNAATSAASAASTAQGSANSAASAASAAQATANSAASAASSAQSTANSAASAAAAAQTIPVFAAPANLPSLPSSSYPAKFGPVLTSSDWSLWKVNDAGSAWDRILFASTGIFGQLIASQIQVDDTLRAAIVDAAHVKTQLLTVLPDSTDTGNGTVQIGGGAIKARSILAQNLTLAGDNLIPNPNSEQAAPPGGWPSGAWEAVGLYAMVGAYQGGNCRRLVANGSNKALEITPRIPVSQGDQFYMEGYGRAYGGGAGVGSIYLHLRALDANQNGIGSVFTTNTIAGSADSGWIKISGSGACPAGTVFVQAELYSESQTTGASAFFDNLYLRRRADANLIVDGTLQALFARIARAIQSTNYVAGSAGNAPVGFCLSATPFTTTFKDGTTDSTCLMELGGSANFGGYKVATINTQVMTAYNRIQNGSFWRVAAPWSAQPRIVQQLALPANQGGSVSPDAVTAVQSITAPGYTSGTVYLKFTPSASMILNSGSGAASVNFRISVYLRNHATGVETLVYQTTSAYARSSGPTTWAPGQQSINVTSYLSSIPSGYGIACVIDNVKLEANTWTANATTYTGTIDVTGFELVF